MSSTLGELAKLLGADLIPAPGSTAEAAAATAVTNVAPIATATQTELTFLSSEDFAKYVGATKAAAIIAKKPLDDAPVAQLIHANPYFAFARAATWFNPAKKHAAGRHPQTFVAPSAQVDPSATIYPFVYVGDRAKVLANVILHPGVFIGDDVEIGEGSELRANVVVEAKVRLGRRVLVHGGTVLGADGFGFAPGEGGIQKIPQIGAVVIADDVEIGGLCTVDRGALENTVIGHGSKLDSHVHVAHGVIVGQHCMLCGMAGVAGSAKLGDGVVLAGHSAVNNRVEIASGSVVGAMSGVTKDLPEKGTYMGFPAMPAGDWRRMIARTRRLGDLEAKVKALEARLTALAGPPASGAKD